LQRGSEDKYKDALLGRKYYTEMLYLKKIRHYAATGKISDRQEQLKTLTERGFFRQSYFERIRYDVFT